MRACPGSLARSSAVCPAAAAARAIPLRRTPILAVAGACLLGLGLLIAPGSTPARAQVAPPATAPATAAAPANPVVAKVDGHAIRLSDVEQAAAALPPKTLLPMLLERMIDARALVAQARREGMEHDPAVQKQMAAATDQVLENAILSKEVKPLITPSALKAAYQKDIAGKPGPEEVHAEHILVPTKAEAEKIIAKLNKGADFATLAKQYSKDPGAKNGGDLGFFKKDEMVPAFADAAFALKPGTYTKTPVHSQFGWHVIKVLARRQAPAPTFAEAEDGLRQKILKAGVEKAVAKARAGVKVELFNLDGTPAATAAPATK